MYSVEDGKPQMELQNPQCLCSAMATKCAVDFHFETRTANCSTVPFTTTAHLDELSRGLKARSLPKSKFPLATLLVCWNLMGNGWRKAIHIFSKIGFLKDTILSLQSISVAMLDLY